MRHRSNPATTTPLLPVNLESRSQLNERSSTLEYQHNLALLEEDWQNSQQQLGTPSSVSSSLFDICRCCGKQDCDNLEYFNRTVKKLESDTRLAAEIGQGLLHKHETFVTESNGQRIQLEKQLEECHERITGLEQSLDEVENEKDVIVKEKNKWLWEYQKRQKILDETLSDLETANEKCNQLSLELDSKSSEIEKLRIFKFMVRHSETREEALTSKLEDTNQELAVCRKNELVLESKIKKLKMRYESLYNSHEQLSRDVEEKMNTTLTTVHNTTQNDSIKLVSSNNNNTNDLINLIKELSSANTKLKSDLMNCRDQLSEARGEVTALMQKIDDNESGSTTKKLSLRDDLMKKSYSTTTSVGRSSSSKPAISFTTKKKVTTPGTKKATNTTTTTTARRAASVKERKNNHHINNNKKEDTSKPVPIRSKTAIPATVPPPLPVISSSLPTANEAFSSSPSSTISNAIVHHHYHYYVKNSKGEAVPLTDEMSSEGGGSNSSSSNEFDRRDLLLDCCSTTEKNDLYTAAAAEHLNLHQPTHTTEMVLSPSTSSVITIKDGTLTTTPGTTQSPYKLLQEHVTQVLDRLRGSDILALNRRLKRAFDITELSSMSNSVIDNILMDIDTLESRFLWIKTTNDEEESNSDLLAFFPLVDLLKDMLKELGILRTTMNELQVEYVKKVEESEIRVEEEILKKRQLKKQQSPPMTNSTNTKPLSWLTNMFYKSNNNKQPMKKEDKAVTTTTTTTATASHTTTNNATAHPTHDRGSTLTKSTTNSSTLILSPDEEDHYPSRKDDVLPPTTINEITRPNTTYATRINNHTFPRQPSSQKRPIPHFPSQQQQQQQQTNQIPNMMASSSNGTSRSSPSIPIRNKRSSHRIHIDYEGIGPAAIRPIPSDRDDPEWKSVNISSSWLGGK